MAFSSDHAASLSLCCGLGSVVYYGPHPVEALGHLLTASFDAWACCDEPGQRGTVERRFPGRCLPGDSRRQPDRIHDIAVIDHTLDGMDPARAGRVLITLRPLVKNVMLLVRRTESDGETRGRDWWEALAIRCGMRRHPRGQQVAPYWTLNDEADDILIFLESVPEDVLRQYSLEGLAAERDLHMDMLREAGRRSDAHLVRYHMAARHVRPGDTILDCACGLGYGAHILFHNSPALRITGVDLGETTVEYARRNYGSDHVSFVQGDAQDLSFLPDNSVDFITGFETIEHLPDPERYVRELARVLRPSGRIMLSVPNRWPIDPHNCRPPFHCHEYDWDRFRLEIAGHFLLDQAFAQTAGGGGRCSDSPRTWKTIALDEPLAEDCEWLCLLGMKDPMLGKDLPFVETTHVTQPDHPDFHATDYAGSYSNPWLAKGVTTWPMANPGGRVALSERILASSPETSADYGAALCVLAYRQIDRAADAGDAVRTLEAIEGYIRRADDRPHCVRWKISLRFVGALLLKAIGKQAEAEEWFALCGGMDPTPFSPMSGTKIVDALYQAALLALVRGETGLARMRLETAMDHGQALVRGSWFNVVGDPHAPVLFGLHDLAQIMEFLVRCGYALHNLSTWEARPGLALAQTKGLFEVRMDEVRSESASWKAAFTRSASLVESLKTQVMDEHANSLRLAAMVSEKQKALEEALKQESSAGQSFHETRAALQETREALTHSETLVNDCLEQLHSRDAQILDLTARLAEQEKKLADLSSHLNKYLQVKEAILTSGSACDKAVKAVVRGLVRRGPR